METAKISGNDFVVNADTLAGLKNNEIVHITTLIEIFLKKKFIESDKGRLIFNTTSLEKFWISETHIKEIASNLVQSMSLSNKHIFTRAADGSRSESIKLFQLLSEDAA